MELRAYDHRGTTNLRLPAEGSWRAGRGCALAVLARYHAQGWRKVMMTLTPASVISLCPPISRSRTSGRRHTPLTLRWSGQ